MDEWSTGAVLYTILAGYQPFDDMKYDTFLEAKNSNNMGRIVEMITKGEFALDGCEPWDRISTAAKDLIKKLMEPDPKKRISAAEALEHTWIVSHFCIEKRQKKKYIYIETQKCFE